MTRSAVLCVPAIASALLLLTSAPALACEGHGQKSGDANACAFQHGHGQHGQHAQHGQPEEKDAALLAPEDRLLSATCTCTGKGDCTCKKGSCECKKCGKHHGVKETTFVKPLKGASRTPNLPDSGRLDASAGTFI